MTREELDATLKAQGLLVRGRKMEKVLAVEQRMQGVTLCVCFASVVCDEAALYEAGHPAGSISQGSSSASDTAPHHPYHDNGHDKDSNSDGVISTDTEQYISI